MSFNRDSLATIVERIKNNMELRVRDENGAAVDAHTRGTGYTEMCEVIGGVSHELRGNQAWIADQILVSTAADETIVREAAELGIPRIDPKFSAGTVTATGTDGKTITSETVLQHSGGLQVRTVGDVVIVGGVATLNVIAMQTGVAGNLAAAEELTFISPIDGVDSTVVIDEPGLTAGTDIETILRLTQRVLERKQQPPMGGNDYDYVAWAKAAHVDVTRVFVFSHENGIGSITVRFVTEDLANTIPTAAHVTAVDDYTTIKKPTGTRNFIVEAPIAKPLNLVFTTLEPNTQAVQAAIDAELLDFIRRNGKCGGTLILSQIREAISSATGEENFSITLAADVVCADNEFPTLGATTWPGP